MTTAVAGVIGLLVQLAIAIFVIAALHRRSVAYALLGGAVVAVYGYGLALSTLMLFAVPWTVSNVLFAVAAAIALSLARFRGYVWAGVCAIARAARTNWAAASLLIGVVAFQILVNALKPELSIDGQLYHGPILASLVDTGSLWGWTPTNQYVYYTDLTMASSVNLATFTGATWFDDAAQVPQLVILMLAIVWALRQRFSSALLRTAFATLLVAAPVIWIQPRILYVDVAYGAAVLTTMVLIALTSQWSRSHVLLAGVAAAAVLATKPTGILTSALLALAVIIAIARSEYRAQSAGQRSWWVRTLGEIGLLIIPFVAALSFYVRNFIAFSNPVYPVAVKFGRIDFPGIIDLSIFASGERGSGFVDPTRLVAYARSLWHGVRDGVTKLDYDPRDGGYGQVPLFIAALLVALLIAELVVRARQTSTVNPRPLTYWRAQVVLLVLAVGVLVIQPSTFDTRYVIGPTAALTVAALLTTFGVALPRLIQMLAAVIAIGAAGTQVVWTETHVFPGLKDISALRTMVAQWQPVTPGNPWGRGESVSWMPDSGCVSIAVETSGGVIPSGMSETALLSALPYGLAGAELCNTISPVIFSQYEAAAASGPAATANPLVSADFFLAYDGHVDQWDRIIPNFEECWRSVQRIPGTEAWPESVSVFANTCAR